MKLPSRFPSLRNADGRGDGGSSCPQTAVEAAAFYARYLLRTNPLVTLESTSTVD